MGLVNEDEKIAVIEAKVRKLVLVAEKQYVAAAAASWAYWEQLKVIQTNRGFSIDEARRFCERKG